MSVSAETASVTAASPDWKEIMEWSFSSMDAEVVTSPGGPRSATCWCELRTPKCNHMGSTAVVAVVFADRVVVANCVDSRAVLCQRGAPVPLSLSNSCSTIGAIIMTPLLTKLLAGQLVPIDAAGLAISTFQVVLLPTIIGVLLHEYFPKFTEKIITLTPLIGVNLTTLLRASPIGQVAEVLKTQGGQLIPHVTLLPACCCICSWLLVVKAFIIW